MSIDLSYADAAAEAATAADDAARSADLQIAEVDDIATLTTAAQLMDEVWSNGDAPPLISASTLKALAHSGSYVSVATSRDQIVGALIGFLGWHGGAIQLHSHILGVSPRLQGRAIGYALKQHQRAWALARDIGTITWTFDPLVRRNAYFNLTKLGASITAYYDNFYGDMSDAINAGDETDRVLVEWELASPRVAAAGRRHGAEPDIDEVRAHGGAVVLSVADDGSPIAGGPDPTGALLVQVPDNIVAVRERSPEIARRWRRALRATFGRAITDGYAARGMTRSGWYVLENMRG